MDELWKEVIKGAALLIALGILEFLKRRRDEKKEEVRRAEEEKRRAEEERKAKQKEANHSPAFTANIAREVKHEAQKIRDRHQAMRVFVIEFSNGTETITGLPLWKVTFKYEVVVDYGERQVERISPNYQELPMPEMFGTPMNITFKAGEFYNKNVEGLNKDDIHQKDYYDWLRAYGVKSSMWLLIKKNNKPAAILVMHWPQPTDLDGTVIARIKDIKRNIEKIYNSIQTE